MRKVVMSAIAIVGLTPMFFLGAAPRADAATSCYEGSCNGLAAASTTCASDAEVIYQVFIMYGSISVGNIELKYSPSCRAAWARVVSDSLFGGLAAVSNTKNQSEECFTAPTAGATCNTTMINDGGVESSAVGDVFEDSTESELGQADTPYY